MTSQVPSERRQSNGRPKRMPSMCALAYVAARRSVDAPAFFKERFSAAETPVAPKWNNNHLRRLFSGSTD